VDFYLTYQLLIRYSAFVKYWRKMYNGAVYLLFVHLDKRRTLHYNILTECGISTKVVRLLKRCLTKRIAKSA